MNDNKHIKRFDEVSKLSKDNHINENNSSNNDKVVEMHISNFDMDEHIDYRLVIKTSSGKTFYVKAKPDSPLSFED